MDDVDPFKSVRRGLLEFAVLTALIFSRRAPERTHRIGHALAHWAMPEVYVLGTLVALTRLGSLVEVEINAGFWSYVAMSIALLLAWRAFRLQMPETTPTHPRSGTTDTISPAGPTVVSK